MIKQITGFNAAELAAFLAQVPADTQVIVNYTEYPSRAAEVRLARGSYDGMAGVFHEGRGNESFVVISPLNT